MKLSLQVRISLLVVGLLLAIVGLTEITRVHEMRSMVASFSRAAKDMNDVLLDQVRTRAEDQTGLLAAALTDTLSGARLGAVRELTRTAREQEGVRYVVVYDARGHVVAADPADAAAVGPGPASPLIREAVGSGTVRSASDGRILWVVAPVRSDGRLQGSLRLGLSLMEITAKVNGLGADVQRLAQDAEARHLTVYAVVVTLIVLTGIALGLLLVREMVRPLRALSRYIRRIGTGKYNEPPLVRRSDEIGELAESLGQMAKDLKQVAQVSKLATLGELAVGMAHELNQPLNTIRLAAENALSAIEADKTDRAFEVAKLRLISDQAARMGEMIQRMCVVGRGEGTDGIIDPREAVRDACSLVANQFADDGIVVALDLPENCAAVAGQRHELAQVVINLLTNARDAILDPTAGAPPGRPRRGGRIDVGVESRSGGVVIQVRDNGGGIAPGIMERIFDPFFTTKEVTKGTGLGLSISYGIVSAMGGRLTAANVDGGALFTLHLPVADIAKAPGL